MLIRPAAVEEALTAARSTAARSGGTITGTDGFTPSTWDLATVEDKIRGADLVEWVGDGVYRFNLNAVHYDEKRVYRFEIDEPA